MLFLNEDKLIKIDDSDGIIWRSKDRIKQSETCLKAIVKLEKEYSLSSEEISLLIKELKDIYTLLYNYYKNDSIRFDSIRNKYPNIQINHINEKKDKLLSLLSRKDIKFYLFKKYESEFIQLLDLFEENREIIKFKFDFYHKKDNFSNQDSISIKKLKRFIYKIELPLIGKIVDLYISLLKLKNSNLNPNTKQRIDSIIQICSYIFKYDGFLKENLIDKFKNYFKQDIKMKTKYYLLVYNQVKALENKDLNSFKINFEEQLEIDESLNMYDIYNLFEKSKLKNKSRFPFLPYSRAAILILAFFSNEATTYAQNYVHKINNEINIEHTIKGDELKINNEQGQLFEKYFDILKNDTLSDKELNIKKFNYLLINNPEYLNNIIQIYEKLSQSSIKVNSKYNSNKSFSLYFNYISQNKDITLLKKNHEKIINFINLLNGFGNNVYEVSEYDIEAFEMLMAILCYSDNSIFILNKLVNFINDSQININGLEYYNFLYQIENITHEQLIHYSNFIGELESFFKLDYFKNSSVTISLYDFSKEHTENPLIFKELVGLLNKIDTRGKHHTIEKQDFLNLFNIVKSKEFITYFFKYLDEFKINLIIEEFNGIIEYYFTMNNPIINYNNNDFLKVLNKLNKKGYKLRLASDLFNIMYYSNIYNNDMIKLTARYNVTHFNRFKKQDLERILNLIKSKKGIAHLFKSKKQQNKNAVIFYSKADFNSVLSSTNKKFKISQIPEIYNISIFEVNSDEEMLYFLETLNKKIDLMVIVGHGHSNIVKLGYTPANDLLNPDEDEIEEFIMNYETLYLDLSDTLKAKKIISYMNPGSSLVFKSCSVGEGEDSQDNLINFFGQFSSEITVFGPDLPIQSIILIFDDNNNLVNVKYYGLGDINTYKK